MTTAGGQGGTVFVPTAVKCAESWAEGGKVGKVGSSHPIYLFHALYSDTGKTTLYVSYKLPY